jgi:hypothetical protein
MYVLGHVRSQFRHPVPGPARQPAGLSLTVAGDRAAGAVNAHPGAA